jgi:hypothetical protein
MSPAHMAVGPGGAAGAARHLGGDKTECPPLPPTRTRTGADGKSAHIMMARAHRSHGPARSTDPTLTQGW